jgi:hypothetical protein
MVASNFATPLGSLCVAGRSRLPALSVSICCASSWRRNQDVLPPDPPHLERTLIGRQHLRGAHPYAEERDKGSTLFTARASLRSVLLSGNRAAGSPWVPAYALVGDRPGCTCASAPGSSRRSCACSF